MTLGDEMRAAAVAAGCGPGTAVGALIETHIRLTEAAIASNDRHTAAMEEMVVPALSEQQLQQAIAWGLARAVAARAQTTSRQPKVAWTDWFIRGLPGAFSLGMTAGALLAAVIARALG